jgi:putative FmdB family regulatory protein
MPIYEYRCGGCGKKVTVLTLRVSEAVSATCDRCGSGDLRRLMSRFAMVRSDEARMDGLGDDAAGLDENDPKSVARWMRKMGKELGEDAGEDFDEMVDELEAGGDGGEGSDDAAGDEGDDF